MSYEYKYGNTTYRDQKGYYHTKTEPGIHYNQSRPPVGGKGSEDDICGFLCLILLAVVFALGMAALIIFMTIRSG